MSENGIYAGFLNWGYTWMIQGYPDCWKETYNPKLAIFLDRDSDVTNQWIFGYPILSDPLGQVFFAAAEVLGHHAVQRIGSA